MMFVFYVYVFIIYPVINPNVVASIPVKLRRSRSNSSSRSDQLVLGYLGMRTKRR
ncbi:hypothetical protein Hdeb2414_s0003g00104201 [Helianthus debilis subsp. tardiflorus]